MKIPIQNLFLRLAWPALFTLSTGFSTAWAQGGAWSTRAPVPTAKAGSAGMKLPERQLVVEIEHDEQFVARPAPAGCHAARLPWRNH